MLKAMASASFSDRRAMATRRSKPSATPAQSGSTFDGEFVPQNLWKIYDMPSSDMGQGQTMAVFGDGNANPVIANLRVFEQRAVLRPRSCCNTALILSSLSDGSPPPMHESAWRSPSTIRT